MIKYKGSGCMEPPLPLHSRHHPAHRHLVHHLHHVPHLVKLLHKGIHLTDVLATAFGDTLAAAAVHVARSLSSSQIRSIGAPNESGH